MLQNILRLVTLKLRRPGISKRVSFLRLAKEKSSKKKEKKRKRTQMKEREQSEKIRMEAWKTKQNKV